jgi:PTS system galactitol-specific IIA component
MKDNAKPGNEFVLREDLVFTQKNFERKEDAIYFLAEELRGKGYVDKIFPDVVIEREKTYPTGLYLGKINVAIPHTNVNHVLKSGVAILTLSKPVIFKRMDEPSEEIEVHIIFLLAVADPKEHLKFLSNLIGVFRSPAIISSLYEETDPAKISARLTSLQAETR